MTRKSIGFIITIFALAISLWQCKSDPVEVEKGSAEHLRTITNKVDDAMLNNSDNNHDNWVTHGRGYSEDRYSKLTKINKENVAQLGLAWTANLGTKRGLQATPLVVDGILFFSGPNNLVWAYDARTGKELWKYDAGLDPDRLMTLCCGVVNRGLAMYKGNLYMGTLDGRLVAIDAATGTKKWEVLTIDPSAVNSITGAPRIVKGNVVIGNGGAELGARGYVTAYDAETGKQKWRFYTVPGDPSKAFENPILEKAAETWTGEWWKQGGGGTVWDAIVYDPKLNMVYIGVGNGAHWDRQWRSPDGGDNLFLSSIVALNADDGTYVWHYQTTPGDSWDYTATQPIILADIEIEGKMRQVLMQAPKNGYFYVIDRTNGEFISADNFVYQNWTTGMGEDGRPIEAEGARYSDGQIHWIAPSSHGGHNWHSMSYSHQTGYVYIPSNKQTDPYYHSPGGADDPEALGAGVGANVTLANKLYIPMVFDPNPNAPIPNTVGSRLIAWDPVAQKEVWGVDQVGLNNGGILSTAGGLVFQADATGKFTARDAATGDQLWQFDVRSGAVAAPVTYTVDGEQYVTILVGWGGYLGKLLSFSERIHPGTVYTFKLGGQATPPEKLPPLEKPLTAMRMEAPPEQIGNGWNVWTQYCIHCHPALGTGDAAHPDILRSSDGVFKNFNDIVVEGALISNGMPSFKGKITEQEIEDLKSYIFYTSKVLSEGMSPTDYITSIAQMQYLADQKKAVKN